MSDQDELRKKPNGRIHSHATFHFFVDWHHFPKKRHTAHLDVALVLKEISILKGNSDSQISLLLLEFWAIFKPNIIALDLDVLIIGSMAICR